MGSPNVLPDCRTRARTGATVIQGCKVVPLYCGHCYKLAGYVQEELITGAFYLCPPCAETHGDPLHCYKEPEEVFWERVRNAQAEQEIPESPIELAKALEDPSSVAAKLAEEWRKHVLKGER